MELIAFPFVFAIWYLFYDSKPLRNDEIGLIWEKENTQKRIKIKAIINKNQ